MGDMQFRVSTGTAADVTFAIYDQHATTYGPGDLMAETTWTATSNNTSYTWSSVGASLSAHKIYWFAWLVEAGQTMPTIFALNDNAITPMLGRKLSSANYSAQEYIAFQYQNQTSMPDPAPSVGSMSTPSMTAVPRIGWM